MSNKAVVWLVIGIAVLGCAGAFVCLGPGRRLFVGYHTGGAGGRVAHKVAVAGRPARIPPDGVGMSTITVHVADLEGVPLGNKEVNLGTDAGILSASLVTANEFGTAEVALTSSATPDTATVTATCDGTVGRGYVEFASLDAPHIRIVSPGAGETVDSGMLIRVEAKDDAGGNPGILSISYSVDSEVAGCSSPLKPELMIDTAELSNGIHILRATACDNDGVEGYS